MQFAGPQVRDQCGVILGFICMCLECYKHECKSNDVWYEEKNIVLPLLDMILNNLIHVKPDYYCVVNIKNFIKRLTA